MAIKQINGYLFEKMLRNGLENLRRMEKTLNDMNVFPVADGDTGSNMLLTLENGLRFAQREEKLCNYLRKLNEGLLLGARGNSGVLLSQLFKGVYLHLSRCSAANCGDMRNAFIRGYKTAYQAMMPPVEGTILTVAREGIEHIRYQIDRNTTMEALFIMYVAEMRKSLAQTPEILPALKAAGVVDGGALGYITIIEGMSMCLNGKVFKATGQAPSAQKKAVPAHLSFDAFNENSAFNEGYCMEFILQLMVSSGYVQDFKLENLIRELKPLGSSIAATQEGKRVKVHIHTKKPAWIITVSQKYGEFLTFKLENMQLQHNEQLKKQSQERTKPAKAFGVIATANGAGLTEEFKKLGCDIVVDGGPTMNAPSSDFLTAFNSLNASAIVVLPNNKNMIGAVEQAVQLSQQKNIHVIPTKSVAEGYFAMAMDLGNEANAQKRVTAMQNGAQDVITVAVAISSKEYADEAMTCKPGDSIALVDDQMVFASDSPVRTLLEGLRIATQKAEKETCLIFSGAEALPEWEDALVEQAEELLPDLEISFTKGDQPTYLWVCGLI